MPTCPSCPGSTVETNAQGVSYCTQCSEVIDQDHFVNLVEFTESSSGKIGVSGTHVSSDGFGGGFSRGGYGYGRSSREMTLNNCKKVMQDVAGKLQLNGTFVDRAHQIYKMALSLNITKGRKLTHIVAACLYIICRQDKTPHILLDFSDIIETNVYVLGSVFLMLCRALNIKFESIIDPCIFIWRYAKKLEFGSEFKAVVNSAMDLVKRMKRDWIDVGRRPDGLCGAALLIAARMHNFSRTVQEVIDVVRVCDLTLRTRLMEFEVTPSGSLTASEFETVFLEEECDPPSFTRARLAHQNKLAIMAGDEMLKVASKINLALTAESGALVLVPKKNVSKTASAIRMEAISDDPENLDDVDDYEIAHMVLTEQESGNKATVWNELNKEYLEEQKEKEEQEKKDLELGIQPKRKGKKKQQKRESNQTFLVGDRPEKAKSKKLNYSALIDLGLLDATDTKKDEEEGGNGEGDLEDLSKNGTEFPTKQFIIPESGTAAGTMNAAKSSRKTTTSIWGDDDTTNSSPKMPPPTKVESNPSKTQLLSFDDLDIDMSFSSEPITQSSQTTTEPAIEESDSQKDKEDSISPSLPDSGVMLDDSVSENRKGAEGEGAIKRPFEGDDDDNDEDEDDDDDDYAKRFDDGDDDFQDDESFAQANFDENGGDYDDGDVW